jgi:leucyl-tRNA synthetase
MEGKKMSKSMGNIIPLREAIKMFGADPLRFAVLATSELLQDADFSSTLARSVRDRLERFYRFAVETVQAQTNVTGGPLTLTDRWMLSRLQEHIRTATESMDKLMVRKAIHSALYALDQDFQWYLRRIAEEKEVPERKSAIAEVFKKILDAQVRMLAPVTPHICEEIWEKMGRKGFVSLTEWPRYDEARVDIGAEEGEALIRSVLEDTLNIIKATRIAPKRINYYVAAPWKWKLYLKSLEKSVSERIILSDLMKELMAHPDLRETAEKVAKFAHQIIDEVNRMPDDKKRRHLQVKVLNEHQTLKEAENFFEQELNAEVHVYGEEDSQRHDPKKKSELARPYRPAIYIE